MTKQFERSRSPALSWNRKGSTQHRWTVPLLMTAGMITLAFLTVGGARDDILSLLIWRPVTMVIFALAIAVSGKAAWQNGRPVLIFAACVIALLCLHLIPLPPAIWSSLPGRHLLVDLYRDMGIALPWRPISVAEVRTWNALFSLAGPIGVLIFALSLRSDQSVLLLRLIIGLGLLSGLVGLMQSIGPDNGPLYFYSITNHGMGVGLFANRNHQAIMLAMLFPMLAAHLSIWSGPVERLVFQRSIVLAAAALLIPQLLVAGSRTGLVLGVVALGLSWWIYEPPHIYGRRRVQSPPARILQIGGIFAAAAGVLILTILASRAQALDRLLAFDSSSELRIQAMPAILDATRTFFPVGSGIGTFVETYKVFEPYDLLAPEYLNHAHNDFLEVLLTAGIPGVVLVITALGMGGFAAIRLGRAKPNREDRTRLTSLVLARTGLSALLLLALGSISDYPLRVPSLALLGAVFAAWVMNEIRSQSAGRLRPAEPAMQLKTRESQQ